MAVTPAAAPNGPLESSPGDRELAGLFRKLAAAQQQIGKVARDGRNRNQHYDYATAEALLGEVRNPLADHGVVLLPELDAIEQREHSYRSGESSTLTTVKVRFTFCDTQTGATLARSWAGSGDDPGDKGLGKAYTNALKTFVRSVFLIPTGDDPEADEQTDRRARQRAVSGQATRAQRDYLKALASEHGIPNGELVNLLCNLAGGEALPDEQAAALYDEALRRLTKQVASEAIERLKRRSAEQAPAPPPAVHGNGQTPEPAASERPGDSESLDI